MKKNFTKWLSLALVVMMLFAITGCGNSNNEAAPTEAPAEEPATPEAEAPAEEAAPEASGDAEYAVVLKVLSSPFWQSMKAGIEEKAAELGVKVDIYAANSEDDVEGQVTLLENAVSKGYKAIAVAPISADNLNNAIAEATKKGIYIINIDEGVNLEGLNALGGTVYSQVSTDNIEVGSVGANYIIDLIGGTGQVAVIEGKAGAVSGEDRRQGATDTFKAKDGIELVESQPADWDRTKAYDVATNYITKHPDLKGIYCCNDTMAMGALEAVKASGKDIKVVGTDGNEDAVESVNAGELTATVAQDPAGVGARGLEMMIQAVKEGAPIDIATPPIVEKVSSILIKKD